VASREHPLAPLREQLKKWPGIGQKAAQRLAYHLIKQSPSDVEAFATELLRVRQSICYCDTCFNISVTPRCYICEDDSRLRSQICVVANPQDLDSIEQMQEYKGQYHVLGGLISPLDGVHPDALRIEELIHRLDAPEVQELILAINPTVEGDTTVLYIKQRLEGMSIRITQLAYGLPMGADIDYADSLTLEKAFEGRR